MVLLLAVLSAYAYVVVANQPPDLSKLRVNYEGGFIRRGLLGEFAYLLRQWVDPNVFLATICHFLYAATAFFTIRLLTSSVSSRFFQVLIYMSPAALVFPVVDSGALYRADIVAIAIFALHARFPSLNKGMLAALLVLSMLTHELQLFFLPFHAGLLVIRQQRMWPLLPAIAGALVVALHTGEGEDVRRAICDSWNGMDCPQLLDWGLKRGFLGSLAVLEMAGVGYLCALIVAVLPVVILVAASPDWSRKHSLLMLSSAAFGMLLFLVGVDYGRWINLIVLHAMLFVTAVGIRFSYSLPLRLEEKIACVMLYVLLWRIPHVGTDGILRGKLYAYLSYSPFSEAWYWVLLPVGGAPLLLLSVALVKRRVF